MKALSPQADCKLLQGRPHLLDSVQQLPHSEPQSYLENGCVDNTCVRGPLGAPGAPGTLLVVHNGCLSALVQARPDPMEVGPRGTGPLGSPGGWGSLWMVEGSPSWRRDADFQEQVFWGSLAYKGCCVSIQEIPLVFTKRLAFPGLCPTPLLCCMGTMSGGHCRWASGPGSSGGTEIQGKG